MQTKTEAIVLRSLKYGDGRIIADLLTEAAGRVSFIVRIPTTARGKLQKQLFQPLTYLEVEYDHRQNKQLQHLRGARLLRPWLSIPFDAHKLPVSLFLSEFLTFATRSEQSDTPLFRYVADSIEWLDTARGGFANFHVVFMMRLTRFLGFFPNVDDYHEGDFFDLREGRFISGAPRHSDFLRPDEARLLPTLMRLDYASMHLFRMSRDQRNRCTDAALAFYRLHVAGFPELKSIDVVRELFA